MKEYMGFTAYKGVFEGVKDGVDILVGLKEIPLEETFERKGPIPDYIYAEDLEKCAKFFENGAYIDSLGYGCIFDKFYVNEKTKSGFYRIIDTGYDVNEYGEETGDVCYGFVYVEDEIASLTKRLENLYKVLRISRFISTGKEKENQI